MSKDMSWPQSLELGKKKEALLIHSLNANKIKAVDNTIEIKTDIDIELIDDNMYVDSKYLNEVYENSFTAIRIQPFNCLTVRVNHINEYNEKEKETGKEAWIGCLVDYLDYEIYEYAFFPVSYLKKLVDEQINTRAMLSGDWVLHFDRRDGLDFYDFMSYIKNKRKMNIFK